MKVHLLLMALFLATYALAQGENGAVVPTVTSVSVDQEAVTVLPLSPGNATSGRLPEEVNSVVVGNPAMFKAEHAARYRGASSLQTDGYGRLHRIVRSRVRFQRLLSVRFPDPARWRLWAAPDRRLRRTGGANLETGQTARARDLVARRRHAARPLSSGDAA